MSAAESATECHYQNCSIGTSSLAGHEDENSAERSANGDDDVFDDGTDDDDAPVYANQSTLDRRRANHSVCISYLIDCRLSHANYFATEKPTSLVAYIHMHFVLMASGQSINQFNVTLRQLRSVIYKDIVEYIKYEPGFLLWQHEL